MYMGIYLSSLDTGGNNGKLHQSPQPDLKNVGIEWAASSGQDTPNRHQRTSGACRIRIVSPVSQTKRMTRKHSKDYSRWPTSLYVLPLRERKYLSIPPGGDTLYSSFIERETRNCRSTNRCYGKANFTYDFRTILANVAKQLGKKRR